MPQAHIQDDGRPRSGPPASGVREIVLEAASSEAAGTALAALFDLMTTLRRNRTDPSGISGILAKLASAGPLRSIDLAASLGLDQSTVSRHVQQLESEALVERIDVPEDRRAHLVGLTEAGRAQALEVIGDRIRFLESALADWPDADIHRLAHLLDRFTAGLNSVRTHA